MKNVTITKDQTAKLMRDLKSLAERQVLVGIPDKTAGRKPKPGEDPGMTNAALGYLHETGSPAANIPARPFLKPGVAGARDEIVARYRAGAKAVLDGKVRKIDAAHHEVGIIAQRAVRAKITEGPFEELAPATLADRRRRGRTGTRPLIDTGQLRTAVTYVVRDRKPQK